MHTANTLEEANWIHFGWFERKKNLLQTKLFRCGDQPRDANYKTYEKAGHYSVKIFQSKPPPPPCDDHMFGNAMDLIMRSECRLKVDLADAVF